MIPSNFHSLTTEEIYILTNLNYKLLPQQSSEKKKHKRLKTLNCNLNITFQETIQKFKIFIQQEAKKKRF